jgi:hypothetical protein
MTIDELTPITLEQLAKSRFHTLSNSEVKLLRAALNGDIARCGPSAREGDPRNDPVTSGDWGPERWIRAELVRWLCVETEAKGRVDPKGLRVHAARITGRLDLSFVKVPFFLGLHGCSVAEDIDLEFSEIPAVDLSGTSLPSLKADHVTVRGSILLQGLRSNGAVRLRGACVGGNLECDGAIFRNPALRGVANTGIALDATTLKVAGAVLLRHGFVAKGGVLLFGAEIGGALECDGGKFLNLASYGGGESGIALNGDGLKVAGAVSLRNGFISEGAVWLHTAEIAGSLECDGGRFHNPPVADVAGSGIALIAEGARVGGAVLLRNGFASEGRVWFQGAEIGSSLECDGGKFLNPAVAGLQASGLALSAEGAKVGRGILLRNEFVADGEVRLHSAKVTATIECDGGVFRNPPTVAIQGTGTALNAEAVKVGGAFLLRHGFRADGRVWLLGAEIGGNLDCEGGKFRNPVVEGLVQSGTALSAQGAKIGGSVFICEGFWAEGTVTLAHAEIRETLAYWSLPTETLDVRSAMAGAILDDEKGWPAFGHLFLDGFTYGRVAGNSTNAISRLTWLARQESFAPHPYRQLAKVLKEVGDDRGARRVYVEMERRIWAGEKWIYRPVSWLLRWTIGYGYYSLRALRLLAALIIVGSPIYWWGYRAGSIIPTDKDAYYSFIANKGLPGYYENFHSFAYSIENSFPLVKLGVQEKWSPATGVQGQPGRQDNQFPSWLSRIQSPSFLRWFRWLQVCIGWLLATLFVGGVTGIVRKD